MKLIFIVLLCSIFENAVKSQPTISPSVNNEYCPNTEYTFTVTLTKTYSSMIGEGGCYVTQLPTPPVGTTFTFKGKFADANQKQIFRIYHPDNTSTAFEFKKIKSLFYGTSCTPIQPNQSVLNAPRCQVVNFPISFNNVQWSTAFETPSICFGAVTNYEYQLPVNWKIGTFTSTGSNWYSGGNSVIITSDLSSGDGGVVTIRPANTACGTGLTNGQSQAVSIPISRPAPTMSITPSGNQAFICSGSKTFTLVGLPANATITSWSISNTSLATVPPNSTGVSVSVTKVGGDGTVVLTANVSQCSYTYQVPLTINLGTFVSGYYNVSGNYVSSNNNQFLYFTNPPYAYAYAYSPPNQNILFDCHFSQTFVSNFNWSISGTYSLFYPNSSGFSLYMSTPNTSTSYARNTATIRLTGNSVCGALDKTYIIDAIVNTYYYAMTVSPNPVNQNSIMLKISKVPDTTSSKANNIQNKPLVADNGSKGITVLYLYDFYTGKLIKQWRYDEMETNNYNLNITGIKEGVYLLKLNRDNKSTSTKIIVQH